MRLAIIGSRSFTDYRCVQRSVLGKFSLTNITGIVSGNAPGADTMGKLFADYWLIPYLGFPAAWDDLNPENGPVKIKYNKFGKPYNALAGFNRNDKIISNADYCMVFWDGKSPGTRDSLNHIKTMNKPFSIVSL